MARRKNTAVKTGGKAPTKVANVKNNKLKISSRNNKKVKNKSNSRSNSRTIPTYKLTRSRRKRKTENKKKNKNKSKSKINVSTDQTNTNNNNNNNNNNSNNNCMPRLGRGKDNRFQYAQLKGNNRNQFRNKNGKFERKWRVGPHGGKLPPRGTLPSYVKTNAKIIKPSAKIQNNNNNQ